MINRETIYAALWTIGAGAARFASANRRLRHWSDVAAAEQPALFMSEKGGHAAIKRLGAPIAHRPDHVVAARPRPELPSSIAPCIGERSLRLSLPIARPHRHAAAPRTRAFAPTPQSLVGHMLCLSIRHSTALRAFARPSPPMAFPEWLPRLLGR